MKKPAKRARALSPPMSPIVAALRVLDTWQSGGHMRRWSSRTIETGKGRCYLERWQNSQWKVVEVYAAGDVNSARIDAAVVLLTERRVEPHVVWPGPKARALGLAALGLTHA